MLEGGLTGKVAVVTGAAGGIGGAVATAFADAGAEVVGLDREQADSRSRTRSSRSSPASSASTSSFNGAGISGRRFGDGPVDECTEVAWDTVLATNLKSVFLCSKHAVPLLRAAGGGAIVNLASIHGLVGGDADFATHAYAASKAGIVGLTRAMAVHYAREEIRCNAIAPGLIRTPMSQRAQSDPGILARLPELQPLTGDFGRPGGRRRRCSLPRDRAVRHRHGPRGRRGLDRQVSRHLGLDLGGTYVKWVVLEDGAVAARGQKKTRAEDGPEAVIERLIAAGREAGPVDTVGVGVPGLFDGATGADHAS